MRNNTYLYCGDARIDNYMSEITGAYQCSTCGHEGCITRSVRMRPWRLLTCPKCAWMEQLPKQLYYEFYASNEINLELDNEH